MISVIVPIYNVEHYLPKCLESLCLQSLNNVEFILIDDGSTDRSGDIADSYQKDPRFLVIHTDNKGLSAARNLGIKNAHGEWLMFVDSDDWVSPDFCEKAYQAAIKYEADLVIFQLHTVKNGKINNCKEDMPCGIVDHKTAIIYGKNAAWNKLYRKELFNNLCYPEGRVYEEIAITHKLVLSAKRIVIIPDILYYYVYRKNSIAHVHSAKNKRDGFISAFERAKELESLNFSNDTYEIALWTYTLAFLVRAYPSEDPVFKQAEAIATSIRGLPIKLPIKKRVMLLIWKINKSLFHFICELFCQKDKNSIE